MADKTDRVDSTKVKFLYDKVKNNMGGAFDLYYHLEIRDIAVKELLELSKGQGLDQFMLNSKTNVTLVNIGISFNNHDIIMGIGEMIVDQSGVDSESIIDLVIPMEVCKTNHLDSYIKILEALGRKSELINKLTVDNLEETLNEYRNFKFNNIDEM